MSQTFIYTVHLHFQGETLLSLLMNSPLSAYLSAGECSLSSLFRVWISVTFTVWSVLHGVRWCMLSALGGPLHWSMLSQHRSPSWPPWLWWMHCFGLSLMQKGTPIYPLVTAASDIFPRNSHLKLSQLSHRWTEITRQIFVGRAFNQPVTLTNQIFMQKKYASQTKHTQTGIHHRKNIQNSVILCITQAYPCWFHPNFLNTTYSVSRGSKPLFQGILYGLQTQFRAGMSAHSSPLHSLLALPRQVYKEL